MLSWPSSLSSPLGPLLLPSWLPSLPCCSRLGNWNNGECTCLQRQASLNQIEQKDTTICITRLHSGRHKRRLPQGILRNRFYFSDENMFFKRFVVLWPLIPFLKSRMPQKSWKTTVLLHLGPRNFFALHLWVICGVMYIFVRPWSCFALSGLMFQFSCLTRWPLSLTLKLLTSRKTLNYTRNNKTWNQFVHQEGTAIIMQLQHLLCSCTPTSSKSTKPYMCISNRFPIFDMLFKPTGEKPSFFNALRMSCCLFFSSCHHNTSNPYTG